MIKKNEYQSWIVVFSAALFFFYEFVQMNMFNAISPELMQEFHITATQLGNLSATYLYATVLALFPVGLLLDRFSTKKLIIIAFSVCVAGTIFFASSSSLLMAEICRFIAGAGGAFCFTSAVVLASRWFPPRRLAFVIGLIVTMAMLGGIVAQTPLTLLVQHIGWREALYCDAAMGLVFILIIRRTVKDCPAEICAHDTYPLGFWKSVGLALSNKQNWLCGIYTCLINLPILLLGALWGVLYLVQVEDLTRAQASVVTSMLFIGTVFGSPIVGWFSDLINLRKAPMLAGAFLSLPIIFIIQFDAHLSFLFLSVLFLLLGFFTSTQILTYPLVIASNSSELTGSSEGMANSIIMSGGAIFQPLFGWLMDLHWNGKVIAGVPFYSVANYRLAFLIFPCAFLLGILAVLLAAEKKILQPGILNS